MYTEMPVAVQIHQVFKNRWCGAYFQSKGLKVIPSLVWGEADTFWFSFDGVDEGSVVAADNLVSLNSLAGTPQNVPEKATSGVGGANQGQEKEAGIILKQVKCYIRI